MPSTEKSIRCLTCSAFSLQRSVHKILLRFEKDLSTFAVPRGRMAAMENAGNIARFSADDAKHIIAVGDDRWGVTISATARRYRPQQKNISATRKINIGHNHIGQNYIGHKDIGHKIYGEFIWRHRDDTSRFRVVVNLNVKDYVSHVMSC